MSGDMIKSFHKKKNPEKVFFTSDMNIRSYAYGQQVRDEAVTWIQRFSREWNLPRQNFLLLESGGLGNIPAKLDSGEFISLARASGFQTLVTAPKDLRSLWFEDMLMSVGKHGKLTVNGKDTGFSLGTELKAWGCDVLWDRFLHPQYYLFSVGKPNGEDDCALTVYRIDKKNGFALVPMLREKLPTLLNARSNLYCFGKHIFLIHNGKLDYFHFRPEAKALDRVAIETDEPNDGKTCCSQVYAPVVLDNQGYVYWQAGNNVYSFPIGYPRRITTITGGERYAIGGIQCYKESLFVYRCDLYNREYSCVRYERGKDGTLCGYTFNRDTVKNVIYCENGGALFYIKIPNESSVAYAAMYKDRTETILSDFVIGGETRLFCTGGNVFVGCDYAGK
jgi:hypothetical protein